MKRAGIILISLLFLSSIVQAQEVGHIAALRGKVIIQRPPRSINAVIEEKVFLRDTVETKAASRAKILFKDDSLLTLSENSTVKIKEYLRKEKGKRGSSIFSLLDGEIRALVGKNKFEVHTPTAVAAARGTYFSVWIEMEDGIPVTGIAVHEGSVDASNIDPNIIGIIIVEKGKMTKVFKNSPPTQPVSIPPAIEDKLLECSD